ncbi:sensor domain-containing diguanylate cyclase [Sphingomonas jeddahensis]|uniref:diguanylate cyclase n=1 Tax=Sphingomonas jeddahensis TaxID=1915074 RepID=A0A1V2ETE7_9SPHN|nr:sensor domain-containing diguanylate cyclase [Sphingomonas jeddahensis]ONF95439.1 putative diguanylate cyclase YegE [Sphingomonas jeddahensis]
MVLLGGGYFILSAATIWLTRFDGGVAFLWIATALLTARLTTLPVRRWPIPIAACLVASVLTTSIWGFGPSLAGPLAIINVMEAAIGAWLLHRFARQQAVLDSHGWLIVFVAGTGIVAPLISAVLGGGLAAAIMSQPFLRSALQWYSGHALGTLAFMPIFMLVLRGDAARLITRMDRAKLIELLALVILVALVSFITFVQDHLPLLFLPMLPIVLATFRGGPLSTAASIVILALIGGALTLDGHGPIGLLNAPIGAKMQFLQLYIACTMLTILPANAELQQRADLFSRLRESEARYRVLTENTTDIVVNIDLEGRLRFVSASIRQLSGREPEALIGKPMSALLHDRDIARATASFHQTIAEPDTVTIVEFRGPQINGEARWFETHSRAVVDHEGNVTGVVSAIRDITLRKAHEERLTRAALTDPLTGLINRRGLDEELAKRLTAGGAGCVALFDLDHFKHVNDTYGHAAGDEVLRRFAALARSSVRDQDVVARLGGEEFAVVLPEATIDQARLVCDRVRRAVGEARVRIDDRTISVTVSGGVASYRNYQPAGDVLRAADRALYRAKNAGRDQLALAA